MQSPERHAFDHVGMHTTESQPGEVWVESTRSWVTSPRAHPANIEWIRWEADSPVRGLLRDVPHVAYRVADVHAALAGHEIVAEPFDLGNGFATIAFVLIDGALVEFMQYANPDEQGWF